LKISLTSAEIFASLAKAAFSFAVPAFVYWALAYYKSLYNLSTSVFFSANSLDTLAATALFDATNAEAAREVFALAA
jgi:hypothetical protein